MLSVKWRLLLLSMLPYREHLEGTAQSEVTHESTRAFEEQPLAGADTRYQVQGQRATH